ncbi:MAG: hypothetical protein ACOH2L_19425 [Devosia sp.]
MSPVSLTRDGFADFKLALRSLCMTVTSSHADEALASAFGFRTYAALGAAFAAHGGPISTHYSTDRLLDRLSQLGYRPEDNDVSKLFRRCSEIQFERIWQAIRSMQIRPANDNSFGV